MTKAHSNKKQSNTMKPHTLKENAVVHRKSKAEVGLHLVWMRLRDVQSKCNLQVGEVTSLQYLVIQKYVLGH